MKTISIDLETYQKVEARAKQLGLTVEEYVSKVIREKTGHG